MFRVGALVVGLLVAAALAWSAGEHHYENCVRAAKDAHSGEAVEDIWDRIPDGEERTQAEAERERRDAIDGCARTPW